jgi:predicted RecA/RadA family phage recombinase
MATNYVGKGDSVQYTAGANLTSGQPVLMGDVLGICLTAIASGAVGSVALQGVYTVAKNSAEAWAIGDILFWDAGSSVLTKTASTHKPVGHAFAVAANPSSTGQIKLCPLTKDTDTDT